MEKKRLSIPLSERDVGQLKAGDVVFLDGSIYTGRSLFHIRCIEEDICPPIDYNLMNVFVHIGPVMERVNESWAPVSIAPTSGIRFEKYGAAVIKKLGIRAIIGKTTMGKATMEAMKEVGCVHLTVVGVMGNLFARQVKRVRDVHFLDELGKTEATRVMDVENAGPFIVSMDIHGNNLFHHIDQKVKEKFKEFYEKFDIKEDFSYTEVNP